MDVEHYNYDEVLVVVAGHVTNEDKKNHVIRLCNDLKKDGYKTCYVTHTNYCLTDLSNNVDFVYYDKNNLLIDQNDYYDNANLFDDSYTSYGICQFYSYFSCGKLTVNGIAAHCPALTILLKNGIDIANSNNYKWIVFVEYDIITPIDGFRKYIQDKINLLNINNKKCILYPRDKDGFIYPGILIFSPSDILKHNIFLKEKWYKSTKDWISTWKMGFSETVTEHVLRSVFENQVLENSIEDDAKKYWNLDDYSKIHKYSVFDNSHRQIITLSPSKNQNDVFLHLFLLNLNNFDIDIVDLCVQNETQNITIFKINNRILQPSAWNFDTISKSLYNETDIINLQYILKFNDENNTLLYKKQTYNMKYIENIYKYMCKIEINK